LPPGQYRKPRDVAAQLDVTLQTVYGWIAAGNCPNSSAASGGVTATGRPLVPAGSSRSVSFGRPPPSRSWPSSSPMPGGSHAGRSAQIHKASRQGLE
jgi:hypothetical protein